MGEIDWPLIDPEERERLKDLFKVSTDRFVKYSDHVYELDFATARRLYGISKKNYFKHKGNNHAG
jgi:hypothetical protein